MVLHMLYVLMLAVASAQMSDCTVGDFSVIEYDFTEYYDKARYTLDSAYVRFASANNNFNQTSLADYLAIATPIQINYAYECTSLAGTIIPNDTCVLNDILINMQDREYYDSNLTVRADMTYSES